MADPRLLECAEATPLVAYSNLDLNERIEVVRAVILKWLEQPATKGMLAADGQVMGSGFRNSHSATETYEAMCAQAAKEIAT